MENKIPTVDEFVKSRFQNSDRADFESNKRNVIEFAKLHVQAQRKAIKKKATIKKRYDGNIAKEYWEDIVDEQSIDNAYDLNKLK